MGYDMSIIKEIPGEAEGQVEPKRKNDEARALLARLREEGKAGSRLTKEHQALPKDEQKALLDAVHQRAMDLAKEESIGLDEASLRTGEVPATQEYLDAHRSYMESFDAVDRANLSYHRLNIWGMSGAREVMIDLGMLKDSTLARDWPKSNLDPKKVEAIDEFTHEVRYQNLTREKLRSLLRLDHGEYWTEEYGKLTFSDEDLDAYAALHNTRLAHLSDHDASVPGIEIRKLCSNDGWLVTEEECSSTFKIWTDLTEERRQEIIAQASYFGEWMEFIDRASRFGGFQVH